MPSTANPTARRSSGDRGGRTPAARDHRVAGGTDTSRTDTSRTDTSGTDASRTATIAPKTGRTRAPRRDAAANRAALVEAAVRVLNRDIDGSLETIAAEAGLTRRAVYGHFATRDDLVREVLRQGAARIGASILPIEHADARVEIALYGATLWREVQHASVTAEFAVRGPHVGLVAEALEPARAKLRSTVRRGAREGVLRRDIAPDRLARLIEGAALDVLAEATHDGLDDRAGHALVMAASLGIAGLGWREAAELVSATPELAYRAAGKRERASVIDDGTARAMTAEAAPGRTAGTRAGTTSEATANPVVEPAGESDEETQR